MGMLKEFKEFAMKGSIVDLAVAVIIGGAFGAIISALTDNILMPVIGSFIGKSFESLTAVINGVPVQYGAFIQAIVKFIIIAFCMFLLIKAMNSSKKKEAVAPPPAPAEDIVLLREIRDALKK
jgi:large conductance mechanosensitive channel